MEGKKLTRPQNNKMLAGVCAGIANYFGLDPTLIRVVYAFVYLLLWIIIPEEK